MSEIIVVDSSAVVTVILGKVVNVAGEQKIADHLVQRVLPFLSRYWLIKYAVFVQDRFADLDDFYL